MISVGLSVLIVWQLMPQASPFNTTQVEYIPTVTAIVQTLTMLC